MKAILGNFTKISETEFHLKKDMQFAQIVLDSDGNIDTVNYQDKQNIEIGDLLNHNSTDYVIENINTDKYNILSVKVEKVAQPEQDVPNKSNFTPRKMSPRKPRPIIIPKKSTITKEQPKKVVEKIIEPVIHTKPESTIHTPKKRGIVKRVAGWISSKLSSYSNS
jgi:hypothetical protein